MRLQVLELDHVSEITQEVAAEVCREGLKGLEMLVLTATPVTPKALLHFNSERWGMQGGNALSPFTMLVTSSLSLLDSSTSPGVTRTRVLVLALLTVPSEASMACKVCQHLVQMAQFYRHFLPCAPPMET